MYQFSYIRTAVLHAIEAYCVSSIFEEAILTSTWIDCYIFVIFNRFETSIVFGAVGRRERYIGKSFDISFN